MVIAGHGITAVGDLELVRWDVGEVEGSKDFG